MKEDVDFQLITKEIHTVDDNKRLFTGWASVSILDRQGELIPIEELQKTMLSYMDRGGQITDSHTNIVVGKVLSYEIKEKDGIPAVMITGKIFDNYEIDKKVWEKLKSGEYRGLSIGGVAKSKTMESSPDGKMIGKLSGINLIEIALVKNPANPEATIEDINFKAKGLMNDKDEYIRNYANELIKTFENQIKIQKPFLNWKNFEECINDMKSQGKSDESAKKICGYLQAKHENKDN